MSETNESNREVTETDESPVLVAVDFSDDSRVAVIWGSRFAQGAAARLVILHVVHDSASVPGFYRLSEQNELRPIQQVAETFMAEFLEEIQSKNPDLGALQTAETLLVEGLPPGRIIEVAELIGARLIVMGSRGLTGLPHLLLGSVAERVVELAPQPVVVVKAANRKMSKKLKTKQKKKEKRLKAQLQRQVNADG